MNANTEIKLVAPYCQELLLELNEWPLIIKHESPGEVTDINDFIDCHNLNVYGLTINTGVSLSHLMITDSWLKRPILIKIEDIGRLRDFTALLPLLRHSNVNIGLSISDTGSYKSSRILSSLGVKTTLQLDNNLLDCDKLSDLMIYSYFARQPHADIQPFTYAAQTYHPHDRTVFSEVYMDNPASYIYLDQNGKVYLTEQHLRAGKPLFDELSYLNDLESTQAYHDHMEDWRSVFLEKSGCAYCQGWRLCQSMLNDICDDKKRCESFVCEWMDAIEMQQKKNNQAAA